MMSFYLPRSGIPRGGDGFAHILTGVIILCHSLPRACQINRGRWRVLLDTLLGSLCYNCSHYGVKKILQKSYTSRFPNRGNNRGDKKMFTQNDYNLTHSWEEML